MISPLLKVKLLHPGVAEPRYWSDGAAGIDLAVFFADRGAQPVHYPVGAVCTVPTGVSVEIPEGYEGQLRARSSFRKNVAWHIGTLDADYRGEIHCCFRVLEPIRLHSGERIAQLIISPVARCTIQVVDQLSPSKRGTDGFGSTGSAA